MPEKFVSLAALAAMVGLSAEADEAAVTAKLKERLNSTADLSPLTALVKDGKVIIVDTVKDISDRLKKVEEAGTKGIAVLSAKVDGKDVTFTAEDVVKLSAKVDALEKQLKDGADAATEIERGKVIALFAKDGKVPLNADGKAYTADELKKLDVPTLRLLHANTPVTVPLSARGKVNEAKATEGLKGADRTSAAWAHLTK